MLFSFCSRSVFYRCCTFNAPYTLKSINDPFTEFWGSLGGVGERSRSSEWSKETRGGSGRISPQLSCPFLCQLVRDGDTSNLFALWWKEPPRLATNLLQVRKTLRQSPVSHFVNQPASIQQPITSCHDCSVWPVFRNSLIHGKFHACPVI